MSNPRNLAARMGHWSAQHRKKAPSSAGWACLESPPDLSKEA